MVTFEGRACLPATSTAMSILIKRVAERNGPTVSRRLHSEGLVSAYHGDRPLGRESDPTHYFQWRQDRPFHLDYCFVPRSWLLDRVHVGNYADWASLSDHRPVVVDVRVV